MLIGASLVFAGFAVWAVFFRDLFVSGRKKFLSKMFGESPFDEDLIEEHRVSMVPVWMALSAICWALSLFIGD